MKTFKWIGAFVAGIVGGSIFMLLLHNVSGLIFPEAAMSKTGGCLFSLGRGHGWVSFVDVDCTYQKDLAWSGNWRGIPDWRDSQCVHDPHAALDDGPRFAGIYSCRLFGGQLDAADQLIFRSDQSHFFPNAV